MSFALALGWLFVLSTMGRAEEFTWSWDGEEGAEERNVVETPAADDEFKFKWEDEEKPLPVPRETPAEPVAPVTQQEEVEPAPPAKPEPKAVAPPSTSLRTSGIDATQYNRLLQDNLELRERIAETAREEEAVRRENSRLAAEVQDLERRIQLSLQLIQKLEREKGASDAGSEGSKELELQLARAEQEKTRLNSELVSLREQLQRVAAEAGQRPVPVPAPAAETVKADSDLFKRLEEENSLLRNKLLEIEKERQKALKDRTEVAKKADEAKQKIESADREREKLRKQLAEAKASEEEHRTLVKELMTQLPGMEERLVDLGRELTAKDAVLEQKDKALETLKIELERRENRLAKAEKMAVMLEKAREEVRRVSDIEKRDMHYNMAAIYAKEGRPGDAEKEYLKALRVDPTDADVHYNLGILYDEELDDDQRAAMHYRKYLKLNPHGADVDVVREWLRVIEMER